MANKTLKGKLQALGTEIAVLSKGDDNDYISLNDIAHFRNPEFPSEVIQNWMRNRGTVEFLYHFLFLMHQSLLQTLDFTGCYVSSLSQ
jgi:hypothetical protein